MRLWFVPLVSALCSCSSVQVTKLNVINDFMSATENSRACFKSLNQNQKYALIYQGLALDGNKPTPQQIENETTVTDAEIQVGMEWFAEDQKCSALSIQELSNLDFRLGTKVAGWQTEITDIFDDAISNHPSTPAFFPSDMATI